MANAESSGTKYGELDVRVERSERIVRFVTNPSHLFFRGSSSYSGNELGSIYQTALDAQKMF